MFPHRIAMMFSPKDVDTGATTVVDFDLSEIISRIFIKFKATNKDDVNINVPQANITKVELVDGSDVLWTGTGMGVDGVSFYDRKVPALHSYNYCINEGAEAVLVINFGRYPFDRVYALDSRKFRNLQLKITHDENLCNDACIVNELTVWAELFSKTEPSPVGFFQVKEQYAYTPSALAYEEIDLPTDLVLRTLYIDALLATKWLGSEIYDIRLDEDNLKTIMYEGEYKELMRIYRPYFGKYEHKVRAKILTTGSEVNVGPTQELAVVGVSGHGTVQSIDINPHYGRPLTMTSDGDDYFTLYASGYMPHGIGAIPFGDRQTSEDWYDPRGIEKLRLRLQGGDGATGIYRITTQQVRMY